MKLDKKPMIINESTYDKNNNKFRYLAQLHHLQFEDSTIINNLRCKYFMCCEKISGDFLDIIQSNYIFIAYRKKNDKKIYCEFNAYIY